MPPNDPDRDRARTARGEELASLLHHQSPDVLVSLLDNPALDETQLCLLLNRKDIPAEILEEVARRKPLLKNYRVKRALAFHPAAGSENHPGAPRNSARCWGAPRGRPYSSAFHRPG